jgi:hypothetical protein
MDFIDHPRKREVPARYPVIFLDATANKYSYFPKADKSALCELAGEEIRISGRKPFLERPNVDV